MQARCDGKMSVEEQAQIKTLAKEPSRPGEIEKYTNAWDFASTTNSSLSLTIWYSSSFLPCLIHIHVFTRSPQIYQLDFILGRMIENPLFQPFLTQLSCVKV